MAILTYDDYNADDLYTIDDIAQLLSITRDAAIKRIKRWMHKYGMTKWNSGWQTFVLTRKEVCGMVEKNT